MSGSGRKDKIKNAFEFSEDRVENWRADLEQLKHDLKWYNSAPFEKIGEENFNLMCEKIYNEIPELNDYELEYRFRELICSIGDGHIDMWSDKEFEKSLPLMIDELSDGYYVINAVNGNEKWIGEKINTINDLPIETVVEKFEKISNSESDNWKRAGAIDKLHDPHYYKLAGIQNKDNEDIIKINGEDVKAFNLFLNLNGWEKNFYIPNLSNFFIWSSVCSESPYDFVWLEDNNLLLIRFSSCEKEYEDYGLVDFGKDVKKEIIVKKPKALLLDLRGNGGGSSAALFTAFSEHFFKEYGFVDNPNFFIATDNQTFSAGVTTTKFVKEKWGATHIGEATGGSPYTTNVSETANKVLEHSGLNFRISSDRISDEMIANPTEIPDVEIKRTIDDILNDRDPVLEYVVEKIKQ